MLLCYLQSSINDLVENGIEQVADFSVELYGIHRMLTTTCWLFSILPFTHFCIGTRRRNVYGQKYKSCQQDSFVCS